MGLSSTTNRVSYVGDGSSTIFSFPYYFFNQTDLTVYLFDSVASLVYPQTISTNYTVSGNVNSQGVYPSGGSVVMNSAFPSNLEIIVTRSPAQVQNYVLSQNGPINSLALVQQLDYITALVQRLQDQMNLTTSVPDGLGTVGGLSFNADLPQTILLASSAGQVLMVNSGANGWSLALIPGVGSIVPVIQGGTGQGAPLPAGAVIYAANSSQMAPTAVGLTGQVLLSNAGGTPTWGSVSIGSGGVSAGSITGVLGTGNGGTGLGSSYVVGGVVVASSSTQLWSVGPGGQDQVFIGQTAGLPTFGPVNLASNSSVTGILSETLGGTGVNGLSPQYGVVYASSATQLAVVPSSSQDSVLTGRGSSAPAFSTISLGSSAGLIGALPISKGGTSALAQSTAFNALSPLTTKGDTLAYQTVGGNFRVPIGSDNQVLTANSGVAAGFLWAATGAAAPILSVSTKTANYNAATTDDLILAGSGCGTINLYGPSGNTGKIFRVKKTGNSLDPTIIAGSAATIDGNASINLNIFQEQFAIVCDGANWQVLDHNYPATKFAYTPVITGFSVATNVSFFWSSVGNGIRINGTFQTGSTSAVPAGFSLPGNWLINSSALPVPVGSSLTLVGRAAMGRPTGAANKSGTVIAFNGSTVFMSLDDNTAPINPLIACSGAQFAAGVLLSVFCEVPIFGFYG